MAKLDTNLDACQLSGEILLRLRKVIRDGLRASYGKKWDVDGIPSELREYLLQRQAREASINWNLSDSVDALDFAGYVNLYDIISANPSLLQRFLPLAPDAHVLRIRFLELDTILSRIGYCRPISEADLGLLVSFEDRLKKTASAPATAASDETAAPAPPHRPERRVAERRAPVPPPVAPPAVEAPPEKKARPQVDEAPARRPQPEAEPAPPPPAPAPIAQEAEPARPAPPVVSTAPLVGPQELETAVKRGDNKTVLTALYQEVTSLADGLWNGSVTSLQARTWESVRESQWYRERFTKLGLKPISDFFGLFDTAKEKMLAGTSRAELQEFLKEHNFVQVLLALKELFKQHMRS
ncbi:MAG TPA: hypothetical protein VMT19_02000 [Thermoanaerobaculaceae bacterium]|nr:hypothetical protein [Thermoanaerobaculaceae bacterium]